MSIDLFRLAGRTALVTGSARGLGFAIAEGLAAAGARVIVNGTTEAGVGKAVAALRDKGHAAEGAAFDVTDEAAIAAAFARFDAAGTAIDILVNNAGIQLRKPMVELTTAEWQKVLDVNLTSAFVVGREAAKRMIPRGRGKIINIGSMYGVIGVPRYVAYCATKAAIDGLTRSLAAEWARHGIQVNCLAPGYMNTDIPREALADEKTRAIFLSKIPARRIGEPEEVGLLAVYLASAASDFMTGQTVYLDGGMTMAW
jgi:gluconate 5-dehydrogenase